MKRILITGANSYIGTSFETYMAQWSNEYEINTIDMKNAHWEQENFSGYDSILHVAGIAHSESGKITEEKKELYYRINTDLAIRTAQKAKTEGVKQFIYMSSIIIYGSSKIGHQKMITRETKPSPDNCYGDSKVKAENGLLNLQSNDFKIIILRPPMIYGQGSKGNYPILAKYSCKLFLFPKIENKRSMLYIKNLLELIRLLIDNEEQGIFFPQNKEYVNTTEMVNMIASLHGKKIWLTRIFNPMIYLLGSKISLISKVFGDLSYEMGISDYKENYRIYSFSESIRETEGI